MNGDHAAPRVGRVAFLLGFAGLLPQLAAVALGAIGYPDNGVIALAYPLLILSFLGGMWWGFAMRRTAGQGPLVLLAVVPSLTAAALVGVAAIDYAWGLVATGSAIMLTLPVDRWLTERGDAPANWMALRVPLSVGLGGLTIVAGVLAG